MPNIKWNCNVGDSPRATMLRDYLEAFGDGDTATLLTHMRDDIVWELIGRKVLKGKQEVEQALQEMAGDIAQEMVIKSLILQGKMGATDGTMILADGSDLAFCDIYEFASEHADEKIAAIRSYSIVPK